ncbi:MAG: membrane protein insertion efficiency factor YidD [Ignavibacterium sp.]|nr:MAG: membrane protein insertion efficiency factor YidD [Ignavibacterium sp.]
MIRRIKILTLLFPLFPLSIYSQTDWVKWEKTNFDYRKSSEYRQRDYSYDNDTTAAQYVVKTTANAYWYFVSDLDGDNCPFRPSCSAFFVESSKQTNIFQGTLMFFDRFTRDINIYKRHKHYPHIKDGYLYDPVSLYTLDESKINYIPPSAIIEQQ